MAFATESAMYKRRRHSRLHTSPTISFYLLKKTKGQLAANMSKKIQIKMIKQMQMARHKLTSYILLYVSKNNISKTLMDSRVIQIKCNLQC